MQKNSVTYGNISAVFMKHEVTKGMVQEGLDEQAKTCVQKIQPGWSKWLTDRVYRLYRTGGDGQNPVCTEISIKETQVSLSERRILNQMFICVVTCAVDVMYSYSRLIKGEGRFVKPAYFTNSHLSK
jgi:hypothetical protein